MVSEQFVKKHALEEGAFANLAGKFNNKHASFPASLRYTFPVLFIALDASCFGRFSFQQNSSPHDGL